MVKINLLSKNLTYDEYTAAAELYAQVIELVPDPVKAAAMMYRQGRLNGREDERAAARKKAYEYRRHKELERMAEEAEKEGSESANG